MSNPLDMNFDQFCQWAKWAPMKYWLSLGLIALVVRWSKK